MAKVSKGLKEWRKKQPRGAIMKPETFENIEEGAAGKYGAERAKKIAGSAYWKSAKAKYKGGKKGKSRLPFEESW